MKRYAETLNLVENKIKNLRKQVPQKILIKIKLLK